METQNNSWLIRNTGDHLERAVGLLNLGEEEVLWDSALNL